MDRPLDRPTHAGLRHLALNARELDAMKRFYVDLLGFEVEWEPDADNVYLSSGHDNLALHRWSGPATSRPGGDAAGGEPRRHRADGFLDGGYPASGDVRGVALVVRRHDLFLEQLVQGVGVGRVDRFVIAAREAAVDDPAVAAVVALRPPAIGDAQVRDAVEGRLHAARPARFERLAGVVEPDVAAL